MKRKLLLLSLLVLLLIGMQLKAGGPWLPEPGSGLMVLNYTPLVYNRFATDTGGLDLNRNVYDMTIGFYGELAFNKRVALTGYVPLKLVGTKVAQPGDFATTLPGGRMASVGNTEWHLKYAILRKGFRMSASVAFETKINNLNTTNGLRTGYAAWGVGPFIQAGTGTKNGRMYFQWEVGYLHRTDSYSDELRGSFEFGGRIGEKWWGALLIQTRQTMNNGDYVNLPVNFHTGLYLNGEEYLAYSAKFSYEINQDWAFLISLGGGAQTRFIARSPSISIGAWYKFGGKGGQLETTN